MSAEHARLIGNLLMIGVVRELDEANGRVRVDADGMLTDWIPWLERGAGPG
ncbi:phage baseplate assembly protein V, partial [Pseudomonas aeruginosa]|nr:phage baseplate assembly protein V [Pseudomonas aeruginosa]